MTFLSDLGSKTYFLGRILCMLMIIVSSTLWYVPGNLVHSSFIMDNNNGFLSIDWNGNNAGTASSINMEFDIAQGIAYVTGATTGSLTTINIQPTSFQSWGTLTITSSGSNPIVTLLDCSSTPIPGFISMNYTGSISLSSLSTGSYPCIKVISELQDTTSSIDNITVTRQPLSQLTLTISGPSTITAGDCENYYIKRSSNFVNTSGTYLFVTIPHSGGTGLNVPTPGYGQLPASNPVVSYISNSGVWTTLGTILPDGTIVPPYSIYWITPGSNNGNTHQYTFRLCTDKGMENNTTFDFNATISSPNNPSDQNSSLSSTLTSTPSVVGDCRDAMGATGYILLGGGYHFHPYTVKIENIGTEDLFQPEITMDFDTMINYFLTCDNSAFGGTATGRIQLASGFEWNILGNQASRSASSINPLSGMLFTPNNGRHPLQLPTSYTFTYRVNYFGCTGGVNSLPVPITVSGTNMVPTNLCSLNTSLRGVNTFEGFVFWDINQDGLYDSGTEFILSGAQVVFQRIHPIYGTTIQVLSTTTDANGLYSGILPDDTYTIQVYYFDSGLVSFGEGIHYTNPADYSNIVLFGNTSYSLTGLGLYKHPVCIDGSCRGPKKCMYTNTTNEHTPADLLTIYGSPQTDRYDGYAIKPIRYFFDPDYQNNLGQYNDYFMDNDCDTQDRPGNPITYVEQNYNSGTTFYHFHRDGRDYVRNHVVSLDRIPEEYSIIGVKVYQRMHNGQRTTASGNRVGTYRSSDTGTMAPTVGTYTGNNIPTEFGLTIPNDLGPNWGSTLQNDSRWFAAYFKCININPYTDVYGNAYQQAPLGSDCYGAPVSYSIEVEVIPNTMLTIPAMCDSGTSYQTPLIENDLQTRVYRIATSPDNDVYIQPNLSGNGYYESNITNQDSIIVSNDLNTLSGNQIIVEGFGPNQLYPGATGTYSYILSSTHPQSQLSGAYIQVTLPTVMIGSIPYCASINNLTTSTGISQYSAIQSGCVVDIYLTGSTSSGGTIRQHNYIGQQIAFDYDIVGNHHVLYAQQPGSSNSISYDYVVNGGTAYFYEAYQTNSDSSLMCEPFISGGNCTVSTTLTQYDSSSNVTYVTLSVLTRTGSNWSEYGTSSNTINTDIENYLLTQSGGVTTRHDYDNGLLTYETTQTIIGLTRTNTWSGRGYTGFSTDSVTYSGMTKIISNYDQYGTLQNEYHTTISGNIYYMQSYYGGVLQNSVLSTYVSGSIPSFIINNPFGIIYNDGNFCIPDDPNVGCHVVSDNQQGYNGNIQQTITYITSSGGYIESYEMRMLRYGENTVAFSFDISYPDGYIHNTPAPLYASGIGIFLCNIVGPSEVYTNTTLVKTLPMPGPGLSIDLFTSKFVNTPAIVTTGEIIYALSAYNTGDTPTMNTYIIDALPSGTQLIEAYTIGVTSAMPGRTQTNFDCTGCAVYFSDSLILHQPDITIPYTPGDITTYFELGTNISGTRLPTTLALNSVRFVAFAIDDTTIGSLPQGVVRNVGLRVQNISNPVGSLISNNVAIIGSVMDYSSNPPLLQAIGNSVYTTVMNSLPVSNSIAGFVYHDVNGDGNFAGGDILGSGVIVTLSSNTGLFITSITTLTNGQFLFSGLVAGNYILSYTTPTGFNAFRSDAGVLLSNGNTIGSGSNEGHSSTTQIVGILLSNGDQSINNRFSYIIPSTGGTGGGGGGGGGCIGILCSPFTSCGDGIRQQPNSIGYIEQCDDGNTNNTDGCTNRCTIETIITPPDAPVYPESTGKILTLPPFTHETAKIILLPKTGASE